MYFYRDFTAVACGGLSVLSLPESVVYIGEAAALTLLSQAEANPVALAQTSTGSSSSGSVCKTRQIGVCRRSALRMAKWMIASFASSGIGYAKRYDFV